MNKDALVSSCFLDPSSFSPERQKHQVLQRIYFLSSYWKKGKLPELHHRDWEVVDFNDDGVYAIMMTPDVIEAFAPEKIKEDKLESFLDWSKKNFGTYSRRDGQQCHVITLSQKFYNGAGQRVVAQKDGQWISEGEKNPLFMNPLYFERFNEGN